MSEGGWTRHAGQDHEATVLGSGRREPQPTAMSDSQTVRQNAEQPENMDGQRTLPFLVSTAVVDLEVLSPLGWLRVSSD